VYEFRDQLKEEIPFSYHIVLS